MRISELLRLVLLNICQNKFKSVLTSVGIVVGAATIVMVIAIGRGGQMDVAEQFSSLNAGAIDISYEYAGDETSSGSGFSLENVGSMISSLFSSAGDSISSMFSGGRTGGGISGGEMSGISGGGMSPGGMRGGGISGGEMSPGGMAGDDSMPDVSSILEIFEAQDTNEDDVSGDEEEKEEVTADRFNREDIVLSTSDVDDLEFFVPGISEATISYTTVANVEGGNLTEAEAYTIAGVYESYYTVSNLKMAAGEFVVDEENDLQSRVCVLGSQAAKTLFGGSAADAEGETLYLDDRAYTVVGVLSQTGTVSANITLDDSIFVPYQTGIKYITGTDISPVITVISEDVNAVSDVIADAEVLLSEKYSTSKFNFTDAGSKMEAAESSNQTLTLLLTAMAVIVFLVGGIGIMNVLLVSVKERTSEIGILKAIGASRSNILFEFLLESAAISMIGGVLGVALSFAVTPLVELYGIRVEPNAAAWGAALLFSILTGTIFGFYPAWQASRQVPVEALNAE